jgi:hypothetical protein
MRYTRHVLDQKQSRTYDLGESRHTQVEPIPRIGTPGVVVEVAVSLARRSPEREVEPIEACSQRALAFGQASAKVAVKQIFDARTVQLGLWEVVAEYSQSVLVAIDSYHVMSVAAHCACSFVGANR